jgi:hypothetical protein
LTITRRLIDGVKVKNIVNIELGLEMIALAMAISSEVCNIGSFKKIKLIWLRKNDGVFPEMPAGVGTILRRLEYNS